MAFDVYSPCPCGSGKKLKFCCQPLAGEMDKAQTFFENKQYRNALLTLEGLSGAHPGNAWLLTLEASIYLEMGKTAEANAVLRKLIDAHPNHLLGIGLFALTELALHSRELKVARPAIYRAFQRCPRAYPDLVFSLATTLAQLMEIRQRWMTCRAHLTLALKFSPDDDRQDSFYRMLEFDGDTDIPYLFRGVHQLAVWEGDGDEDEEIAQQTSKGQRLSAHGCFGPAARVYERLADQFPDNPVFWQNAGLCRAWEGEESTAAEALHRAAELHTDFETAVEVEALAQLLDRNNATGDNRVDSVTVQYHVPSVAKLLTILDDQERCIRQPIPQADSEDVDDVNRPVAEYDILDRSPDGLVTEEISPGDLPLILGKLLVFEPPDAQSALVSITGWEGDHLNEAVSLFEAATGDQATRNETDKPNTLLGVCREAIAEGLSWHFPEKTPFALRRKLLIERWEDFANNRWPDLPLMGLDGRTPREAAGEETLRVRLAAAVAVLDVDAVIERMYLDLSGVYEQLGLAEPQLLAVDEQTPLNALSVMQLLRLPISQLSDSQLKDVFRRAMLIQHPRLLDTVTQDVVSRPALMDDLGPEASKVYQTLAILARDRGRHTEALEWFRQQTDFVKSDDDTFETSLMCELRELTLRLEDPSDPELKPLIQRFREIYVPKFPSLGERLRQLLETYGVPAERLSDIPAGVVAGTAPGSSAEQGIWTPGETGGTSDEPQQKLWLPGE